MEHPRPNSTRRATPWAVPAGLVALALLILTQCSMVGDNVTGVTLDRSAPTSCVKQCNDLYAGLIAAEQKRHATETETCLATGDDLLRKDCLHAEAARHGAAMEQISTDKARCLESCARPGAGSAG